MSVIEDLTFLVSEIAREFCRPASRPADRQPGESATTSAEEPRYSVYFAEASDNKDDFRTRLKIERNGEVVAEHFDGGEPEDQTFYRDWNWVPDALDQAYAFGLEDGDRRGSVWSDASDEERAWKWLSCNDRAPHEDEDFYKLRAYPARQSLAALLAEVRAEEREACAKECELEIEDASEGHHFTVGHERGAENCARRIRSRTPKERR